MGVVSDSVERVRRARPAGGGFIMLLTSVYPPIKHNLFMV